MAIDHTVDTEDDTWTRFKHRVDQLGNLGKAEYVLYWDQEIVMPEEGKHARADQISTLSAVKHKLLTEDEMAMLLDDLEDIDLDPDQEAIVRKIQGDYESAVSVPETLVGDLSRTKSTAHRQWAAAKAEDDFSRFAPSFERLVDIQRAHAEHIDPDDDPYAVLFREYDPFIEFETVERVISRLREELVPLIEAVSESDATVNAAALSGTYDEGTQQELCRDALDTLGYEWNRGRLDPAPYPLTSGNQFDCRIGIPFEESDPLGSVLWTAHEFGHSKYMLNLRDDEYGNPLGEAREVVIHKSQARFWQDQIARSEAFWEHFMPSVHERFPDTRDVTPREAYEAVNYVYDDNPIRIEADELTGHLHIIIRFEIERDLMRGDLEVEDVPAVWNDKYEAYLGIRPETDSEGCLQDVHWANGSFGYFPAYSLGSVIAAQLYAAAEVEIGAPREHVRDGHFEAVNEWLRENVHKHGKRYPSTELIERATGEPLTADYFLDYVTEKYGSLYELDDY